VGSVDPMTRRVVSTWPSAAESRLVEAEAAVSSGVNSSIGSGGDGGGGGGHGGQAGYCRLTPS